MGIDSARLRDEDVSVLPKSTNAWHVALARPLSLACLVILAFDLFAEHHYRYYAFFRPVLVYRFLPAIGLALYVSGMPNYGLRMVVRILVVSFGFVSIVYGVFIAPILEPAY